MTFQFLIVDDSRMSRLLLKGMVEQQRPDWTVLQASSGDEALQIARGARLDLVSMDYNMHGLNGIEAALGLRALQPDIRIAILSANIQPAIQQRAAEAGFLFLPKPITPASLQALAQLAGA